METGNSLVENDLIEIDRVLEAEAVLIGTAEPRDRELCEQLIRRIDGVLAAARYALLEFNCPASKIDAAVEITPGFSSPTISPLQDDSWLSVKVLVEKIRTQSVIDSLQEIGCVAILESELRHARL